MNSQPRMTGQADPDEGLPPHPTVDALIRVAAARFIDLGYLGPDGLLDLPLDRDRVLAVRLAVPIGQSLQLQTIGIDAEGVEEMAAVAQVRASSWRGDDGHGFDPARLFDFDRPTGTIIHTQAEHPAWIEVRFRRPVKLTRLRLRNVSVETARQARGLRISVRTRWRTQVIYDGGAQLRAWRKLVAKAKVGVESDADTLTLLDVLDLTVKGEYARAHKILASRVSDERRRRRFQAAVNLEILPSRGLEWTVHGPQRPFRSWSEEERVDYVRDSDGVVQALRSLTPNVCFGFGSVLSVVRDRALIPHDDDLDIIVGFEAEEAATLSHALGLIEEHLRPLGYEVTGGFAAHRHVRRPGRKRVDVFVGIFEGESISWYPGARGGLTRPIVFPPGRAELLGIPCSIPAQPELYLERLYGQGWRVPDPYFRHGWDLSAYADITGAPTPTAAPVASTSARGLEAP